MVDDGANGQEELERLLAELLVELGRRESVVASLEGDLRRCEEQLREMSGERGVRRGDARRLIAAEQLRRRLTGDARNLRKRLAEAVADVERARERRAVLAADIESSVALEETE